MSPSDMKIDEEIRPLLAHLMLGSLAAISGAAKTLSYAEDRLSQSTAQDLVEIIARRTDLLVASTRALAGTGPADALAVLSGALAA